MHIPTRRNSDFGFKNHSRENTSIRLGNKNFGLKNHSRENTFIRSGYPHVEILLSMAGRAQRRKIT